MLYNFVCFIMNSIIAVLLVDVACFIILMMMEISDGKIKKALKSMRKENKRW